MTASTVLTFAYIFGGLTGWGLCRLFWLRERQARELFRRIPTGDEWGR